jgi:DNA polymerase-3 subunit alpha
MSSEPLNDVIPIMRREQDGAVITQFDYPACEALGLIKMDFLGLRNLTVLDDALANIAVNRQQAVVLEDLTLDDPETFALLGRGDTLGVFQLDGAPMRALLRSMKPDSFADISAVGALYRPGPMGANAHNKYANRKNGREPIEPIHPELAEPLAEIWGDRTACWSTRSRSSPSPSSLPGTRSARPTCCARPWARRSGRCWTPSSCASPPA